MVLSSVDWPIINKKTYFQVKTKWFFFCSIWHENGFWSKKKDKKDKKQNHFFFFFRVLNKNRLFLVKNEKRFCFFLFFSVFFFRVLRLSGPYYTEKISKKTTEKQNRFPFFDHKCHFFSLLHGKKTQKWFFLAKNFSSKSIFILPKKTVWLGTPPKTPPKNYLNYFLFLLLVTISLFLLFNIFYLTVW
jgi:hypothetical protein